MASIQEKCDALLPEHQALAEKIIDMMLVIEKLELALDNYIEYITKHPDTKD
ncbi:hypothetical protein ES703_41374 [subsurface metagenome]